MRLQLKIVLIVTMYFGLYVLNPNPTKAQSPDLWQVIAQPPITALPYGVAINVDDSVVYVAAAPGDFFAVDATSFDILASRQLPVGDSLEIPKVTPDGSMVIIGAEAGGIFFLDPTTLDLVQSIPGTGPYLRVAVTSDSQTAISVAPGFNPGFVNFYDLQPQPALQPEMPINVAANPWVIAITPDENRAYITFRNNGAGVGQQVRVLDLTSQQFGTTINAPGRVFDIAMDTNRNRAYVSLDDSGVLVIDTDTDTIVAQWSVGPVAYLAYQPDIDVLVALGQYGDSGDILFIDPDNGQVFQTLSLNERIRTPAFSSDGERLYVAGLENGTLIVLEPINNPPVAIDDVYSTDEDTPLTVPAPGTLDNDTDGDDDLLTAVLVNGPTNGTVDLALDGSFTYTPTINFVGDDLFTYEANDGIDSSNVATVTVTVNAVPIVTCGGHNVFETAPDIYEAPGYSGNLIVGTSGYDWLIGTNGPDLILGLQGPDDIFGKDGDDVICGGQGIDIIKGQKGNDVLYGDGNADWLIGGPDDDTLYGGKGWDDLEGNGGQDTLHGEEGYDVLLGGFAADDLFGEAGPDDLYGNQGDDDLHGGLGNDFCRGGPGEDTITECEGLSSASIDNSTVESISEAAARSRNDGESGEHAITQRIQNLFIPLFSQ